MRYILKNHYYYFDAQMVVIVIKTQHFHHYVEQTHRKCSQFKACSGPKKASKMAEAKEAKTAYIDAKRVVKHAIYLQSLGQSKRNSMRSVSPSSRCRRLARKVKGSVTKTKSPFCVTNMNWLHEITGPVIKINGWQVSMPLKLPLYAPQYCICLIHFW